MLLGTANSILGFLIVDSLDTTGLADQLPYVQTWFGVAIGWCIATAFIYVALAISFFYLSRRMPGEIQTLLNLLNRRSYGRGAYEIVLGASLAGIYLIVNTMLALAGGGMRVAAFSNVDFIIGGEHLTLGMAAVLPVLSTILTIAFVTIATCATASVTRKHRYLLIAGTTVFLLTATFWPRVNILPPPAYLIATAGEGLAVTWIFLRYGVIAATTFLLVCISYLQGMTVYSVLRDSSPWAFCAFTPLLLLTGLALLLLFLALSTEGKHNNGSIPGEQDVA